MATEFAVPPNRGLAFNVDSPVFIWGSVLSAVVMFACQLGLERNHEKTATASQKRQLRRDAIAYTILIGVSALLAVFFVRALPEITQRMSVDPTYPSYRELPICFAVFSILTASRLVLVPLYARLGRWLLSRPGIAKHPDFENRAQRFAGQFWKVGYHTAVTVAPLWFLRNERWWPPTTGDLSGLWDNFPFVPAVPYLREYYMIQLGYYLHALVVTLIQRSRPNYVQMVIHHVATLVLVICSYFIQNNVRHGTIVFWVHDVCDIPVCLSRLVVDLPYVVLTGFFYITLLVFWAYFRLWVYPTRVVWVVAYESLAKGWVKWDSLHSWSFTTPMLVILVFMHIVWFFELLTMASTYLRTGKTVDSTEAHHKDQQRHAQEKK